MVSGAPILSAGLQIPTTLSLPGSICATETLVNCEGADAFCYDWVGENNWQVPPVSLIPRVVKHLAHCKAVNTLIVPEWVSFLFWLMLFGFQSPYHSLVEGIIAFADVAGIFIRGSSESILTDLSLSLMY